MDADRARQLLARERERIERALASLRQDEPQALADEDEPGELGTEGLYQDEFDAGTAGDLAQQLASLERAESRLADGTYGLSVVSGEPIPDERLEIVPTAELTVEEQQIRDSGRPSREA
jgi:DnaK suppressor protein